MAKCFTWFPDSWPSVASLTAGEVKSEEQPLLSLCEFQSSVVFFFVFFKKQQGLHKSCTSAVHQVHFAFVKKQNALACKQINFLFSLWAEKRRGKKLTNFRRRDDQACYACSACYMSRDRHSGTSCPLSAAESSLEALCQKVRFQMSPATEPTTRTHTKTNYRRSGQGGALFPADDFPHCQIRGETINGCSGVHKLWPMQVWPDRWHRLQVWLTATPRLQEC